MNKVFIFLLLMVFSYVNSQNQIGQDIDGETSNDSFGQSVSLSSDASVLAVGGYKNSDNGSWSGHVRVFQNVGGNWVQVGQDIDGDAADDQLGYSVSLNSNGNILAVGAFGGGFSSLSYVKVYQNQSGNWLQIGNTVFAEDLGDNFGNSVALNRSGTILAVGAPGNNNSNGTDSGHVRVYENQNGNWAQIGSDINGDGVSDRFGHSVRLNGNGSVLAAGAIQNFEPGYVKVFENQGGNWVQLGSSIAGETAGDDCGFSVDISSNGTVLAVASENANSNNGHVRVYEYLSNTWTQIGSNIDSEGVGDAFGHSLSLNDNGNVLAVGAQGNDGNGSFSGHARVFENQGGSWVQIGNDIDGEASADFSGRSVSLSGDGFALAIGAPFNDGLNGVDSGHVRVYDLKKILSTNDDVALHHFKLYPNPVTNEFVIQLQEGQTFEAIEIYNTLGRLVLASKNLTVNVEELPSGVYIVKIFSKEKNSSVKLIVH